MRYKRLAAPRLSPLNPVQVIVPSPLRHRLGLVFTISDHLPPAIYEPSFFRLLAENKWGYATENHSFVFARDSNLDYFLLRIPGRTAVMYPAQALIDPIRFSPLFQLQSLTSPVDTSMPELEGIVTGQSSRIGSNYQAEVPLTTMERPESVRPFRPHPALSPQEITSIFDSMRTLISDQTAAPTSKKRTQFSLTSPVLADAQTLSRKLNHLLLVLKNGDAADAFSPATTKLIKTLCEPLKEDCLSRLTDKATIEKVLSASPQDYTPTQAVLALHCLKLHQLTHPEHGPAVLDQIRNLSTHEVFTSICRDTEVTDVHPYKRKKATE